MTYSIKAQSAATYSQKHEEGAARLAAAGPALFNLETAVGDVFDSTFAVPKMSKNLHEVIDQQRSSVAEDLEESPDEHTYLMKFNEAVDRVVSAHDLDAHHRLKNAKIDCSDVKMIGQDLKLEVKGLHKQHGQARIREIFRKTHREVQHRQMNQVVSYYFLPSYLNLEMGEPCGAPLSWINDLEMQQTQADNVFDTISKSVKAAFGKTAFEPSQPVSQKDADAISDCRF